MVYGKIEKWVNEQITSMAEEFCVPEEEVRSMYEDILNQPDCDCFMALDTLQCLLG